MPRHIAPTTPTASSWTVPEAMAVAYTAFVQRFGADLLHASFAALNTAPAATMAAHQALAGEMGKYISHALVCEGAALRAWMDAARADPKQVLLLLDLGVRWWLARDAMLRLPAHVRVPCQYAEGMQAHVSLQLLGQLLHRASAPETIRC